MQCNPAPNGMHKNWPYIEAPHVNSFIPCPIAMTHQSPCAQSEVATVQPTVEIKESGVGLGKSLDNPGACKLSHPIISLEVPDVLVDLPPQASCLEPGGRPRPHQAYGAGQNSDPDEAFTLHRRMYPLLDTYASTANPIDSISPASHGLLTAEEGNIGVRPRNVEAVQDPTGNTLGESHPAQAPSPGNLPLPHCHYAMDRDNYLPHSPLLDPVYHDGRLNYDGNPYRLGGWYEPSGRGPDAHYGHYQPPFILLLPLVGDIWGYLEINIGKSVRTYARCSLHSVI